MSRQVVVRKKERIPQKTRDGSCAEVCPYTECKKNWLDWTRVRLYTWNKKIEGTSVALCLEARKINYRVRFRYKLGHAKKDGRFVSCHAIYSDVDAYTQMMLAARDYVCKLCAFFAEGADGSEKRLPEIDTVPMGDDVTEGLNCGESLPFMAEEK